MALEEAFFFFKTVSAVIPQVSFFGPLLYLMFPSDVPAIANVVMGKFNNDTVIIPLMQEEK